MTQTTVAFLGPEGTYSQLVAQKRFGRAARIIPLPTIGEVFSYVARHRNAVGVVPVENSSGGVIHETIDILMANSPRVAVSEELSLNVKLALLGRKGKTIRRLYSHLMPLEHCRKWIKRHLPKVEKRVASSTAVAAREASADPEGAALASRNMARPSGLAILQYPVEADVPNLTVFLVIGHKPPALPVRAAKTTLDARLPNIPGSLCTFLEAFRVTDVNLCRIVSRPIRGSPRQYAFLVDIDGDTTSDRVRLALLLARRKGVTLRVVGSYPCRKAYES
jgi:chorismate mutase/prephenate dehydratase